MKPIYLFSIAIFFSTALFAEVPVIDVNEDKNISLESPTPYQPAPMMEEPSNAVSSNYSPSNLSVEERLSKIEQQMAYLQQTLSPAKINSLEQSIQELRGLIEIQGHQIRDLSRLPRNTDNELTVLPVSSNLTGATKNINSVSQAAEQFSNIASPFPSSTEKTASDKEIQVYANAFNYIKQKQYSPAISGLQDYLRQYPNGQYAASAHYWLGELNLISGNTKQSTQEFNTIIQTYPNSDKVPDALLKLGNLSFDQGRYDTAKAYWQKLTRNYPNTAAARIADLRLNQLATTH